MSYCVHCGVELDKTAVFCPLCRTPVLDPAQPVDGESPPPFPTERSEVPPVSRWELALLISVMLACVSVCCGALNFFLRAGHAWSLYIIGAAAMLWIWLAPPLIVRRLALWVQLGLDGLAIAAYVLLVALELDGLDWYVRLALPIILLLGACALFLGLVLRGRRSILSGAVFLIGTAGCFLFGLELFIDCYLFGQWTPGWSLIVLAVCVGLIIPLIVVRRVPSLREEARRRFHL